jgi:hypothetical protein
MASPLSPGNSDTVSIATGEGVTLDTAAGDVAVIEAVSGVAGSANREILARHTGGRAFYGPFLPSGSVKISAVNGVVEYEVSTGFSYDEGTVVGGTNLSYTAATRVIASDTGTDATLPLVSSSDAGLAPASGGGETNFLRADGTWAAPPGGAGISDGDKGDIAVSSSGATWTIDAGVVTLAKMANLAQDQFIGRTTASTGVPQTATITAAARTVLDDTTVAAMVDTLGGASSTGTGGLVRNTGPQISTIELGHASDTTLARSAAGVMTVEGVEVVTLTRSQTLTNKTLTAPAISAPVITGVSTYSGASNLSETSLGDFAAHIDAGPQVTSTMTGNATLTFDSTPSDGRVFGPVRVPANSGGPYTLTIPSSVNTGTGATITTVSVPASGQVELTFRRIGSTNYVYGVPASTGTSTALADITDMSANARTFNAAADYSAMRTALGVAIGSNVQAYSATLGTLAGASANGQSLVTAANYSAMRTLLTLVPGTDVQAYDADLATIAGLTATTDNFIQSKSGAWASRTVAQVAADLNGTGLASTNLAYRHIPQNSQSTAYTAVAADAGGHILHPTADNNARTFTIPANSSVAYPIGTAITFVNLINTVTIAITTDTLILAGAGTTGSRTLAANGVATAMKITSTSWIISGTGLT